MREYRHPGNSGKCPFYIDPDDVLTAEASICQCVTCATRGDAELQGRKADFRQLAYLTILEETPKYDPAHPSQATFITFMKSRVCHKLWSERRKELKYVALPIIEPQMAEGYGNAPSVLNPLSAALYTDACDRETLEDEVLEKIHGDQFREHLPAMLDRLTEKERKVLMLKYFQDYTGRQIAETLGLSKGRVSQLTKTALSKLKTVYQRLEDGNSV